MAFTAPAVAAILTTIFGEQAQDLARIVACTASAAKCSSQGKMDALAVGTLVSTVVSIVGVSHAVRTGAVKAEEAFASVVAALAGAFVALLKAASVDDKLDLGLFLPSFYIFLVVTFALATPFTSILDSRPAPPQPGTRGVETRVDFRLAVQGRIALAILVGLPIGALVQLASEVAWVGWQVRLWGAAKFVVAPSATVIGAGTWAIGLMDPTFREDEWKHLAPASRRRWATLYAVGAILAATGFGALFTPSVLHGAGRSAGALCVAGLLIPSLVAFWVIGRPWRQCRAPLRIVPASLLAAASAAAIACVPAFLIYRRYGSGDPPIGLHPATFVAIQAASSAAAVLTTCIACAGYTRLSRRSGKASPPAPLAGTPSGVHGHAPPAGDALPAVQARVFPVEGDGHGGVVEQRELYGQRPQDDLHPG